MDGESEADLQRRIIDWLRAQDFIDLVFKTDVHRKKSQKYSGGSSRPAGLSDLCGSFKGGRALYIECKTRTGAIAPHQQLFILERQRQGAFACIVRSLEDLQRFLIYEQQNKPISTPSP